MRLGIKAAPVALAVLLAGCGLPGGEGADFSLGSTSIVDEAGLVTAAEEIDPPQPDEVDGVLLTRTSGRPTEVEVSWQEDSCSPGTVLRLPDAGLRLDVERRPGPDDCSGNVGVRAVRLELNRAIDIGELRVTELGAAVGG